MCIKFTAEITPVTFKRPSSNKTRRYNPAEYAQFKDALGFIAKAHMKGRTPLKGAIKLYAEVFKKIIPTSRTFGDWDNHGKAISDALQGICYKDDCIIVDGHVRLFKGEPHINIELEEMQCGK